ncbi:hypothetical protein EON82_25380 [bacterium]|nr:MAG: hypothetical protein EON82_25380 [bacterium]
MSYEPEDHVRAVSPTLSGTASAQRRQLAEICTWATQRRIAVGQCRCESTDEPMSQVYTLDPAELKNASLLELLLAQSISAGNPMRQNGG